MILYAILFIILALALIATFFTGSILFGIFISKGVPFISIPRHDWRQMSQVGEIKPGEIVYDLGCGKANLLIVANKEFGAKAVGYEMSLWPFIWGKFRAWFNGAEVDLRCKNFMGADLREADVVLCYLFPHVMEMLEPKFKAELKPGARVVSYAFKLPNTVPALEAKAQGYNSLTGRKYKHIPSIFMYRY